MKSRAKEQDLYFYEGKFLTELGLKRALIKDGWVWVSRGTFYCYLPASEEQMHYHFDYLRDILYDNDIITEEEFKHFRKWVNVQNKEGKMSIKKNCTWYHCEANDGIGEEWFYCLEGILNDGEPRIETEEQVIEDYCQTLTEEQFHTFLKLSDLKQFKIASKWAIQEYETKNK